ncbi:cupin domain-containing protein [Bizionia argentinensis JUB59]|uniref:Cupin domain-containing protein n=1 Tax=Bizionia argentinensis JUB59 TaxID=1046627 RepID=G2EAN8_9FLAO|nr:cupin domain-containing protein [Bizionia argentinensis]EGV44485.2 cupin domain-containing protein [Bizionia argentinensis JUB59]
MKKAANPKVRVLTSGTKLIAKEMQANAGDLLPAHLANVESILLVQEGECILKMNDEDHVLKPGDAMVIPPEIKHQITVIKSFKAVHFMPNDIEFKFFDSLI